MSVRFLNWAEWESVMPDRRTVEKARKELSFEPAVPLAEGLRRTGVWYKEHGYL